jgi:hypothetical protein
VKLEIVQFFDARLAVFHLHLQMCEASQLAPALDIDWEVIEAFATQEIIQCLQCDELFMSAQHMRDQCYHACRVLHVKHRPVLPYSMIAKVLGVAKAALSWQYKQHRVNATSRIAEKRRVTYHRNTLVMRFPSLFRRQARESVLSLVSAPMDLF